MIQQVEFSLRPLPRGFHLVTNEVMRNLPALPKTGILNLFVRHTSCGLSLNENFDPDVRHDLKGIFERLVPDGDPRYLHQDEGPTDMSAHAKSSMVGCIAHHSHYQRQIKPRNMARNLPLRIQRGRRKPTPHRNDYRGIKIKTRMFAHPRFYVNIIIYSIASNSASSSSFSSFFPKLGSIFRKAVTRKVMAQHAITMMKNMR